MIKILRFLVIILFLFSNFYSFSQFTVTNGFTATQLVDKLVGSGVVYSNATLTCNSNANGFFSNATTSSLTMDSGIVLTTGRATTSYLGTTISDIGTNLPASYFASTGWLGVGGDADLQAASTGPIFDLCKLEFDFVPVGDTIEFNYRFGSEEYPLYTCSNFNDIFSFFISGPGYATPTNLAIIPGTSCPVSINTINGSTANPCGQVTSPCAPPNNALFVNTSASSSIVYDGMTQKMTSIAQVIPCSTYHMKFAIADVFDDVLDSGVFLEANSFSSQAATISSVFSTNSLNIVPQPYAIEGCAGSSITISRAVPSPLPLTVLLTYAGSANPLTDFSSLPSSIVIPANDTAVTLVISPIEDNVFEGVENLIVSVYGSICNNAVTDFAELLILEYPQYQVSNNTTICEGQSVNLSATPTASNSYLQFSWAGGTTPTTGSTVSATPLSTTTYTVTSSFSGCPTRDSLITVSVEQLPTIQLTTNSITCANTVGSIQATATAASTPATITLNPGNIANPGLNANFLNLSAGNYTVVVSSAMGCKDSATTTITQQPNLAWINTLSQDLTCFASDDGSIDVLAQGGVGTISYTLNPGSVVNTSGSFSNLAIGSYTISAADNSGCTAITILNISQPDEISITNINIDSVSCFGLQDGSVSILTLAGVAPLTYTLLPNNIANNNGVFSGLTANTYTIQIADANNCSISTTVLIEEPDTLSWTSLTPTNTLCFNNSTGIISMGATGGNAGIVYWLQPINQNNTNGNFSGLAVNTYTASAVDAKGCTIETTVVIDEPTQLVIDAIVNTNPTCVPGNDGSIDITASGGTGVYNYSIGGAPQASNVFTSLGVANYTIVVSDANGCTATSITSLSLPPLMQWNTPNIQDVSCAGMLDGSIDIVANGGIGTINYQLNGGAPQALGNFPNLAANTYTIQATDAAGCTISTLVNIASPPTIVISSLIKDSVSCANGNDASIQVSATGGNGVLTYTLNPTAQTNTNGIFNSLVAMNYVVTISDANGCSINTNVTILQPDPLDWLVSNFTNVSCFGGSNGTINVQANGGNAFYQYQLMPGNITNTSGSFNSLAAMNYTINAIDSKGCSISTQITISQPLAIAITNATATIPSCSPGNDATITITASGGTSIYTYSASSAFQSSNVITGMGAGNYTITVKDNNNCTSTSVVQIIAPSLPSWQTINSTNVLCSNGVNGQINVTASNPNASTIDYFLLPSSINNQTGAFPNLSAQVYTISATDALNCSITTAIQITEPPKVTFTSFSIQNPKCFGTTTGSITCSASGGAGSLSYTLLPNNVTNITGFYNNLVANNYTIVVTDANGCTISSAASLVDPPELQIQSVATTPTQCDPNNTGTITIQATGGTPSYQYAETISGPFTSSNTIAALQAGTYQVVIRDANGCTATTTVNVVQVNLPSIDILSVKDITCHDDQDAEIQVAANGVNAITSYQLLPDNIQSIIGYFGNLGENNYTIVATDAAGCTVSTEVQILNPEIVYFESVVSEHSPCYTSKGGKILAEALGGTGSFIYSIIPTNVQNTHGDFMDLPANLYQITVKDEHGCGTNQLVKIEQLSCCENVFLPNAFSPNADLKNDEFRLINTYGITLNRFLIVDRWGNIVFESKEASIAWNGNYKGEPCEVGTYYYLVDYTCNDTKKEYLLKGDIMLIR
ncbi:MAG: choice-of-anchor L domain-containing protein [Chitinophagaceae bacterium]